MTDDERYTLTIPRPGGGTDLRFAPFTADQMLAVSSMRAQDGLRVFRAVAKTMQVLMPSDQWDDLTDDWRDPFNEAITAETLTKLFLDMVAVWEASVKAEAEDAAPGDPSACPICSVPVSGTPALMDHISRMHGASAPSAG